MGISMIAKKAFRPKGSGSPLIQPGSPFEASGESQARSFHALKFADYAPKLQVVEAYQTRSYGYQDDESFPVVEAKKTKRTYKTRRMTAEE